MSAILAGDTAGLIAMIPLLGAIFAGCVLGVLLIAWLGCAVLCRRPKQ